MDDAIVLFVDLVGSTALYQSLGNARAAGLIAGLTSWIGRICESGGGTVIRSLGDGVLAAFAPTAAAFECAILLHRRQNEFNTESQTAQQLQFRIGIARGALVASGAGWAGEVLRLATDLSKRCGPEQILATEQALNQLRLSTFARFRNLGQMYMPGRSDPVGVFQVEWQNEALAGSTAYGALSSNGDFGDSAPAAGIRLRWAHKQASYSMAELPIVLGRHSQAQFEVNDPRVSRMHARIYELDDVLVLEDTSRYGTSVRFANGNTVLTLRNQECVLHGDCEIVFGTSFERALVAPVRLNFYQ